MYTEKVLDHFMHPRNVGSLENANGIGEVGNATCGDIMHMELIVEDGIIKDIRFKTFGCFTSNVGINTPDKTIKINKLKIGDEVLAWNDAKVVNQKIKKINTHYVDRSELIKITFQRESNGKRKNPGQFSLITTKDHVYWNYNNKPILARNIKIGQELYEITEHELRKLTNVRQKSWFRKRLSKRMRKFNKTFDHSKLPQNQKGYVCKDPIARNKKLSEASKRLWNDSEYKKRWAEGMANINYNKITAVEQKFKNLFEEHNVAVEYSAGKIWIQTDQGPVSPDFIVPGKKKCIEVYTKNMPIHMQDRSDKSNYVENRYNQLKTAGYETLFLAIEDFDDALIKTQNFVHNGIKVIDIKNITHGNELRGCERKGHQVKVYDLSLEDGAHVYFSNRVASHNCGAAIATSSMATEMVIGKTLAQAKEVTDLAVAEALEGLPPNKMHCSNLAASAIHEAIKDYQSKHEVS